MPRPKTSKFVSKTFSLRPSMVKEVKAAADSRGWNESMIARDAIRMWLDTYAANKKAS